MKLTIIGYDGAYPGKNNATSGYLIETEKTKVLLDCGSAVVSQLQNYIELKDLDGVVFSHFHTDHCADLVCLQYSAMIETTKNIRTKPLVMWGNGTEEEMKKLTYKTYSKGNMFEEGEKFYINDLTFEVSLNIHDVKSYAIKITDSEGKIFVYSGDTGFYDGLIDFVKKSNYFLCECSLVNSELGKMKGHLTSGQVGAIARKAGVKSVILTHLPQHGDISLMENEVRAEFQGEILVASKGLSINIS